MAQVTSAVAAVLVVLAPEVSVEVVALVVVAIQAVALVDIDKVIN
jgi:hypothetical protein